MTTEEQTGIRSLAFSQWLRRNLPHDYFFITDIDFVIFCKQTKSLILLEEKTKLAEIEEWQRIFFSDINKIIKKGLPESWRYLGFHTITFPSTSFHNSTGLCHFDGKIRSEQEMIKILSLGQNKA